MTGAASANFDRHPPDPPVRPVEYEALLSEPIIDHPGSAECYAGWEHHHGNKMRFYVGGWAWFTKVSGLHRPSDMVPHGELAVEIAGTATNWLRMPGPRGIWAQCGLPQFRFVPAVKALYFQKAALILLACELALQDLANRGLLPDGVSPLDVYVHMAIIPACWHIDDFDKSALDQINKLPDVKKNLRETAKQSRRNFIDNLPSGYTVTLRTAVAVKSFCDEHVPSLQLGAVNAKPVAPLGTRHASDTETVEVELFRE